MNFSHRTDPMLLQEIFQTPFSNNNNKIKDVGGGGGGGGREISAGGTPEKLKKITQI